MKKSEFKSKLKEILRPMLNEITMEPAKASSKYQEPCELLEKIKKEVGEDAKVEFSPDSGKVVVECDKEGKKYSLQISENGCDCYSVTAILDGSERATLKTAKYDDIQKLIKETIKNKNRKKYTDKAYEKNAIPEKKESKEKVEETDKCEEVKDAKKQIDHKPVETKDRDIEEITKGTSGMKDSSKFKKQVDVETKDKVKLKADKKNNSNEKLTQKLDGTSKMKKDTLKESIKSLVTETLSEKEGMSNWKESPVADKTKPWVKVEFTHTDGKRHVFYSYVNSMSGSRLSGFDNSSPTINQDVSEIKKIVNSIRKKAADAKVEGNLVK